MKHYKHGGSTAARELACPAWPNLSKGIPRGPASQVAQNGTAMHWLFEQSLNDYDFDPAEYIGKHVEGVEIESDWVFQKVYPAIDMADSLIKEHELDTIHTEVLMELNEDVGCPADVIGWSLANNVFLCGDLKTGDGTIVQAENNAQGMFYTGPAIEHFKEHFDFNANTKILIAIFQPTDRRSDPMDVWKTDLQTIRMFMERHAVAVKRTKSGETTTTPGKHCAWCPAEAVCPSKTGVAQAALRLKTSSNELQALNDGMAIVEEVEKWCKAVRKLAHEQAEQGVPIQGWKLVNKRATRLWNDYPAIERKLKFMRKLKTPDYQISKLVSPAQLEKKCKEKGVEFKQFQEYISSVSSGTTLAHSDDKRPEAIAVKALQAMASGIK